jgi:hypothetical protein
MVTAARAQEVRLFGYAGDVRATLFPELDRQLADKREPAIEPVKRERKPLERRAAAHRRRMRARHQAVRDGHARAGHAALDRELDQRLALDE